MAQIHLVIADTVGQHVQSAARYQSYLPALHIHGIQHPQRTGGSGKPQEHGAWCGWLAGVPMQVNAVKYPENEYHLHYVPVFDVNGRAYDDGARWVLENLRRIHSQYSPDWLGVSRSYGAWDRDDPMIEWLLKDEFETWAQEWWDTQDELGFVDVAASGNNDNNDKDPDVAYPQFLMPDRSVIIGAAHRNGVPAKWSGDGVGVMGTMWGVDVISPNLDGSFALWSGTSSSTPKLAGLAAAEQWSRDEIQYFFETCATYPEGYDRPHPKWGWGMLEHFWQDAYAQLPDAIHPRYQQDVESAVQITEIY